MGGDERERLRAARGQRSSRRRRLDPQVHVCRFVAPSAPSHLPSPIHSPLGVCASLLRVCALPRLLRVFQGDVTEQSDKKSLVMPILGLYAELYAYQRTLRKPTGAGAPRGGSPSPPPSPPLPSPPSPSPSPPASSAPPSVPPSASSTSPSSTRRTLSRAKTLTALFESSQVASQPTLVRPGLDRQARHEAVALAVLREIGRNKSEIFPPFMSSTKPLPRWRRRLIALPLIGRLFEASEVSTLRARLTPSHRCHELGAQHQRPRLDAIPAPPT